MSTDLYQPLGTFTRRLREEHEAELSELLATSPGFTLFLSSNLERFGLDDPFIRFWGTFQDDQLVAVLMMSGQRAALYTLDDGCLRPLLAIALRQRINFLMGPREMVRHALRHLSQLAILRSEAHFFASLAARRFQPPSARVGAEAIVRRAIPDDIERLTALYTGAAGFERAPVEQVRQAMIERVYRLRSHVVEAGGQLVAGASTSAESRQGAMIGGVWTLPLERERGYSTAVVAALSGELLAEGRQPSLFYLEENAPAAHVYKKIGFQDVGRWTVVYFDRAQRKVS